LDEEEAEANVVEAVAEAALLTARMLLDDATNASPLPTVDTTDGGCPVCDDCC